MRTLTVKSRANIWGKNIMTTNVFITLKTNVSNTADSVMNTISSQKDLAGVKVSKVDEKTCTHEFDSHWVPHSNGLVLHLSKKHSKLPQ